MNYLELVGTIIGLIYLWLEYKASVWLWAASIVMPAVYIVIYYRAGLYADMGINIYYILASVYGVVCWLRGNTGEKKELPVTHTPKRLYIPLTCIAAILTVIIAQILIRFTDSNVPWADAFTTALSIVAMWMLAKKYAEQWLAWILVDVVSTILYVYKGLFFTSGLYLLYTVIAYIGYLKWKRMIV